MSFILFMQISYVISTHLYDRNAGSARPSEGFDSPTEPVDTWKGPDAECWDIEVYIVFIYPEFIL